MKETHVRELRIIATGADEADVIKALESLFEHGKATIDASKSTEVSVKLTSKQRICNLHPAAAAKTAIDEGIDSYQFRLINAARQ